MSENIQDFSDEDLIRLAAKGDVEAFGYIYERYLVPIYRYVYYRISDARDAEDLTEDTFVRVWNHLLKSGADADIRNFKAWLYRIAHNLVIDYRRSKPHDKHEYLDEENHIRDSASSVEQASIKKLDEQALEQAIEALEEPLQQVIIMRFISKLSHAETAEILGLKEGHVRVLQYRALKKLRTSLEKDHYDG